MISEREEVKAYYEVFVVEDKTGKITLDHLKAADHVRVVLHEQSEKRLSATCEGTVPLIQQQI